MIAEHRSAVTGDAVSEEERAHVFDLEQALTAARHVPPALAQRYILLPLKLSTRDNHECVHIAMMDVDDKRAIGAVETATGMAVRATSMAGIEILAHLAVIYPLPPLDLEQARQATRFLRAAIAKHHDALPRRVIAGSILEVGLVNPHDQNTLNSLNAASSLAIHPVKMPLQEIVEGIEALYPADAVSEAQGAVAYERRFYEAIEELYRRRGQDVVFSPKGDAGKIIAVADGDSSVLDVVPLADMRHIIRAGLSAARVRGGDNLYQTHKGRIETTIDSSDVVLRLVCVPTNNGNALLSVRITSAHDQFRTLADLRMPARLRERYLRIVQAFTGLILAAGPPSHGKSTLMNASLYMYYLRTLSELLHSVESPVEATLPWLTQHSVGDGNMTYEEAITHLLSVPVQGVMFGDLLNTYSIGQALRFAHTGIPVFGTTHGSSGPTTIWRLLSDGADAEEIGNVLRAVVGVRLVPALCDVCNVPDTTGDGEMWIQAARRYGGELAKLAEDPVIREPGGQACAKCVGGFFGREPLFELFEVTSAGRAAIYRKESPDILAATDPHYEPLWIRAAELVLTGKTSPAKAGMWAHPPENLLGGAAA